MNAAECKVDEAEKVEARLLAEGVTTTSRSSGLRKVFETCSFICMVNFSESSYNFDLVKYFTQLQSIENSSMLGWHNTRLCTSVLHFALREYLRGVDY
jgi:hypothetical protein